MNCTKAGLRLGLSCDHSLLTMIYTKKLKPTLEIFMFSSVPIDCFVSCYSNVFLKVLLLLLLLLFFNKSPVSLRSSLILRYHKY